VASRGGIRPILAARANGKGAPRGALPPLLYGRSSPGGVDGPPVGVDRDAIGAGVIAVAGHAEVVGITGRGREVVDERIEAPAVLSGLAPKSATTTTGGVCDPASASHPLQLGAKPEGPERPGLLVAA